MKLFGRKRKSEEDVAHEHHQAIKDETDKQTAYRLAIELQDLAADVVAKAAELTQEIERDRRSRGEGTSGPDGEPDTS